MPRPWTRALLLAPILALAPLAAPSAAAGPLRPDYLPADAAWAVHADLELAGSTRLGRFALESINEELAKTTIGELEIRPGTDVRDVTLFGWADERASGIVMATMSEATDRLVQHVRSRETYQQLEYKDKPIHSWIERVPENGEPGAGGEEVRLYALALEVDGRRLVLATDSMDALIKATDVVRGEGANRADVEEGASRLPLDAPVDAFLFFATTEPRPFGADDPAAEVSKLADVVVVSVGEREGEGFLNLSVSARTEEEAAQIAQVLQGLAALAQIMIPPDDPEIGWLRKLATGVAFTAEGLHVTAACLFDPEAVIESHVKRGPAQAAEEAEDEKVGDTARDTPVQPSQPAKPEGEPAP